MVRQLVRDLMLCIDTRAGRVTLLLMRRTIEEEALSENVKIAEVCRLLLGDFPANLYRLLEEETEVGQPCLLPCLEYCRQLALKVRGGGGRCWCVFYFIHE
jgi:hypothetical protein